MGEWEAKFSAVFFHPEALFENVFSKEHSPIVDLNHISIDGHTWLASSWSETEQKNTCHKLWRAKDPTISDSLTLYLGVRAQYSICHR
mmetsp:Transcript_21976/g.32459  ORF Transcript_21976/g.32459 Transcript_21976/m.32459 type:complete len:88 (-) Transcript_21976:37-300(-)